jgi:predicted esterase
MIGIANQLQVDGIRWVAPAAKSGSWYPHRFMRELDWNEPYLSGAIGQCRAALREASEDGRLGPEKLVLLGFSQGACIATEYAMRHPGEVAAIIVFTGCLIGPPEEDREWGDHGTQLENLKVLITGSDWDEWIPEEITRGTAEIFEQLGAEVTLRIYQGRPHVVGDEEIAEARALLLTLSKS